jgi:hypothetical protein
MKNATSLILALSLIAAGQPSLSLAVDNTQWKDPPKIEPEMTAFQGKSWIAKILVGEKYNVTYWEAKDSCDNLRKAFNKPYRLPTAEELQAFIGSGKLVVIGNANIWTSTKQTNGDRYYSCASYERSRPPCDVDDPNRNGSFICVRDDGHVVAERAEPQKKNSEPVKSNAVTPALTLTRTDYGKEKAEARAAAADKENDAERKRAAAADQKLRQEEAAAIKAKEEKHRQWCLADKARLDYCSCIQYSPVKAKTCQK